MLTELKRRITLSEGAARGLTALHSSSDLIYSQSRGGSDDEAVLQFLLLISKLA